MNIDENLTEELFKFWKLKTNIAIDLDLLIEDFIYQSTLELGTFIINFSISKSGRNEFFHYKWDYQGEQVYCAL